jgi:hypothetical protein
MKIGFVTITECENFLRSWIGTESFPYFGKYKKLDGLVISDAGLTDRIIVESGNIDFNTLVVGQKLKINDEILVLTEIIDSLTIRVNRSVEILEKSNIELLEPLEFKQEIEKLEKKIKCLFVAYNRIISLRNYIFESDSIEDLKKIQSLYANQIYLEEISKTQKKSIHAINIDEGISSYSVGNMSYSYEANQANKSYINNNLDNDIINILEKYSVKNRVFQIGRVPSSIEFQTLSYDGFYNTFLNLKGLE